MTYRCDICTKTSEPKEPKRRRPIHRRNGQIEKELAVCGGCWQALEDGVPVSVLIEQKGKPIRPLPPPMPESKPLINRAVFRD